MVSINNTAVNSAVLASLRQTNADLATSQNRIASGLKIASAKDNASVWTTSQNIRKDLAAQDTIDGNLAIAKGQADVAYSALSSISDILDKMNTAASQLGNVGAAQNAQLGSDLKNYQEQLLAVAKTASMSGVNLLTSLPAAVVTTAIAQDQGSPINLTFTPTQILAADGSSGTLATIYATAQIDASTSTSAITTYKGLFAAASTAVTSYMTSVGNYSKSVVAQQDFSAKVKDIRTNALSALVDANMEEESARVQSLQVKQQLAFQALSIGNSSAQNILRLFQ
ncbi:flagellin [Aureimonas sp. AU40]|uniref:flagellin n=1 Tax=Aureimonas sp. AU40 TaxID=1637747 RepID=UPI0007836201|nr:flagellin [Aureimonas sp. AU40]